MNIKALVAKAFAPRKSLGGILSGFHKTVDDLEDLITANDDQVLANNIKAKALNLYSMELETESAHAEKVVTKLTALLED